MRPVKRLREMRGTYGTDSTTLEADDPNRVSDFHEARHSAMDEG